jgi:uncharacterized protein (TIGR00255 family)
MQKSVGEMIHGMTGYGRAQGECSAGAWTWEVRSVNGKSVDARVSVPPGFEAAEFEARRKFRDRFSRGSFQAQLRIAREAASAGAAVDTRLFMRLQRLARRHGGARPGELLAAPGVVREVRATAQIDEDVVAALMAGLEAALDQLGVARAREGQALGDVLARVLGDLEACRQSAEAAALGQPAQVRDRLLLRLQEVARDTSIDPDRLAQEAALAAARADVREELDRLRAHIISAREMLEVGGPMGRKLDFLCQELNREANTLCSKSASLELTQAGLALKSLIDQFREQVQNVE